MLYIGEFLQFQKPKPHVSPQVVIQTVQMKPPKTLKNVPIFRNSFSGPGLTECITSYINKYVKKLLVTKVRQKQLHSVLISTNYRWQQLSIQQYILLQYGSSSFINFLYFQVVCHVFHTENTKQYIIVNHRKCQNQQIKSTDLDICGDILFCMHYYRNIEARSRFIIFMLDASFQNIKKYSNISFSCQALIIHLEKHHKNHIKLNFYWTFGKVPNITCSHH